MHKDTTSGLPTDGSLTPTSLDSTDVAVALAIGRALFLWALDPIMLTRPDTGAILDANPAACRVLGLSVDEIRAGGRESLRDTADHRWAQGLRERTRTGSFVGELSMRRGDGSTFPAEVSSSVFEVEGRQYAVLVFRDVTRTRELERELREALDVTRRLAISDDLTGLFNRRGFMAVGQQVAEQAHRARQPLVVLTVDVDGLKPVNDRYGHAAGDEMLREVAAALTANLRSADLVARIGGDEFAVILSGGQATSDAAVAAERINSYLDAHTRLQKRPYALTVSVGIAVGEAGATHDLESLLRVADEAMYDARRARRESGRSH